MMKKIWLGGIGTLAALALPISDAAAQFNGPPRRPRPNPPVAAPPAPAPTPAPVRGVTPPVSAPAPQDDGFALPPPPPPPVAAVPPAEPPFRLGRGDKVVRLRADSATAAITAVSLYGRPMQMRGAGTANVDVLLKAEAEEGYGTPCDTDGFEVRLANGIVWRPVTNFCNSDYVVTVPARRVAAPASLPPVPEGFAWQFNRAGEEATLDYGVPETDMLAFRAACRQNSGRIEARFVAEAGLNPRVDVEGPTALLRYDLVASQPQSEEEPRVNSVELAASDALWVLLRQGLKLPYRVGQGPFLPMDTAPGLAPIGQFVGFCSGR